MDVRLSDTDSFNRIKKIFKMQRAFFKLGYQHNDQQETYIVYDSQYFEHKVFFKIIHNKVNDSFEILENDRKASDERYTKLNGIPKQSLESFFYDDVASWYLLVPLIDFIKKSVHQSDTIVKRGNRYQIVNNNAELFSVIKTKSGGYAVSLPATKTDEAFILDASRVPLDELCDIYDTVEIVHKVHSLANELYEPNINIQKDEDDDENNFETYVVTNYHGDLLFEITKNGLGDVSMNIPDSGKFDTIVVNDDMVNVSKIFQNVAKKYHENMLDIPAQRHTYSM